MEFEREGEIAILRDTEKAEWSIRVWLALGEQHQGALRFDCCSPSLVEALRHASVVIGAVLQ